MSECAALITGELVTSNSAVMHLPRLGYMHKAASHVSWS